MLGLTCKSKGFGPPPLLAASAKVPAFAKPVPWRQAGIPKAPPPKPPPPRSEQKRSFEEICDLTLVKDMAAKLWRETQREDHGPGGWQERVHMRVAWDQPEIWLRAIYLLGDSDLYAEACASLDEYQWEIPVPQPEVVEGWSHHRQLHWAWLRAPGVMQNSVRQSEKDIFYLMGRPYTAARAGIMHHSRGAL